MSLDDSYHKYSQKQKAPYTISGYTERLCTTLNIHPSHSIAEYSFSQLLMARMVLEMRKSTLKSAVLKFVCTRFENHKSLNYKVQYNGNRDSNKLCNGFDSKETCKNHQRYA